MAQTNGLWIRCGRPELGAVAYALEDVLTSGTTYRIWVTGAEDSDENPKTDSETRKFLASIGPADILWLGGELDLSKLSHAALEHRQLIVAGVGSEDMPKVRGAANLLRSRNPYRKITFAMVEDATARDLLLAQGMAFDQIEITGSTNIDSEVLPYVESERSRLAALMGARPAWSAVGARLADLDWLVEAQKEAALAAHRLQLFIAPADPADEITDALKSSGLSISSQIDGQDLSETTQVYVADGLDELGLWLRLAPICLICGTFDHSSRFDPFSAAALGAAMVSGPNYGIYQDKFQRLSDAGATLTVSAPSSIGDAVRQLLSVDRTARMAQAGWSVSTEGYVAIGKVEDRIRSKVFGER